MEITWYGHSCFRLTERGSATVLTDPHADTQSSPAPLPLTADIVTVSHPASAQDTIEGLPGTPYVINGPGEYEVGGVFITGIQTGGQKSLPPAQLGGLNTLYVIDFNSLTVAHLGNLDRVLTQGEVEAVGTVNIALVPIGSNSGLNAAKAAEVIRQLEPNIVVPMHYSQPGDLSLDSLNKFLKEMGLSEVEKRPSLKATSASLPEETQVIVLDFQHL